MGGVCHGSHMEVRRQSVEVGSPAMWFLGISSGCRAWQQDPYPPSHHESTNFSISLESTHVHIFRKSGEESIK